MNLNPDRSSVRRRWVSGKGERKERGFEGEIELTAGLCCRIMERVAPVSSKRTRPLGAVLSILAASARIAVACTVHTHRSGASELLSPLQVGRYAVRAERQSGDYDAKAERQIAFATDSDNAATSERELAAKEEKRARESAYLAADVKSRIDTILEAGRDQVLCQCCVGDRPRCCGVLGEQGSGTREERAAEREMQGHRDRASCWRQATGSMPDSWGRGWCSGGEPAGCRLTPTCLRTCSGASSERRRCEEGGRVHACADRV